MSYYDYSELLAKATRKRATREDRLDLLSWFDTYGDRYWNGEYYELEDGKKLYPVYRVIDDETIELIDAEVR